MFEIESGNGKKSSEANELVDHCKIQTAQKDTGAANYRAEAITEHCIGSPIGEEKDSC